jgi:hypothetical protein
MWRVAAAAVKPGDKLDAAVRIGEISRGGSRSHER